MSALNRLSHYFKNSLSTNHLTLFFRSFRVAKVKTFFHSTKTFLKFFSNITSSTSLRTYPPFNRVAKVASFFPFHQIFFKDFFTQNSHQINPFQHPQRSTAFSLRAAKVINFPIPPNISNSFTKNPPENITKQTPKSYP